MRRKNTKTGFTLLELLVVVLIIGILAAIALPQYKMAVGKVKYATLKDNARVIKNALDMYYMANGEFTANLEALDVELSGTLSDDKHLISLENSSSCYIGSSSVLCKRKIFGINMEYSVSYSNFTNIMKCVANSTDITDAANRLCQQETGKSAPMKECTTYCIYQY